MKVVTEFAQAPTAACRLMGDWWAQATNTPQTYTHTRIEQTHTQTHTCINTCTHMYTHVSTYKRVHKWIQVYTRTQTHAHV
jgi:hypothetical protein